MLHISLSNPAESHSQNPTKTSPSSSSNLHAILPCYSSLEVSLVQPLNKFIFIPKIFGEHPNMSS